MTIETWQEVDSILNEMVSDYEKQAEQETDLHKKIELKVKVIDLLLLSTKLLHKTEGG